MANDGAAGRRPTRTVAHCPARRGSRNALPSGHAFAGLAFGVPVERRPLRDAPARRGRDRPDRPGVLPPRFRAHSDDRADGGTDPNRVVHVDRCELSVPGTAAARPAAPRTGRNCGDALGRLSLDPPAQRSTFGRTRCAPIRARHDPVFAASTAGPRARSAPDASASRAGDLGETEAHAGSTRARLSSGAARNATAVSGANARPRSAPARAGRTPLRRSRRRAIEQVADKPVRAPGPDRMRRCRGRRWTGPKRFVRPRAEPRKGTVHGQAGARSASCEVSEDLGFAAVTTPRVARSAPEHRYPAPATSAKRRRSRARPGPGPGSGSRRVTR
jgi:hypothetical protein